MRHTDAQSQSEDKANAHLIAAAPAIRQELENLVFLRKTAMTKKQILLVIGRAEDLLNSIEAEVDKCESCWKKFFG